jgi:membrane-anchored protein YejM (alkaline phosphatase superfamily)
MNKTFDFRAGTYNVLLITLDSCRYDTAKKAHTPFLSSIASLKRAETHGSYTLPAHVSIFTGMLPVLLDGYQEYLPGVKQIWRSRNAKKIRKSVGVLFDGKNIIDYYASHAYQVIGAGGVSFFRKSRSSLLPSLFPRFMYFQKPKSMSREENVPRSSSQFPLANIDRIVKSLKSNKPFFLFINCPETHVPYDSPNVSVTPSYKKAVKRMYELDSVKGRKITPRKGLSREDRKILLEAQRHSLEWLDGQIKDICENLPKNKLPTLLVALADHGEEMGEGGRYGHAHQHEQVMTVPIWCAMLPPR